MFVALLFLASPSSSDSIDALSPDWPTPNPPSLPPPQLRTVERDKKTMDQEMVRLTDKLLEAKNTIDRLEELNVSLTHVSPDVVVTSDSNRRALAFVTSSTK